MSKVAPSHLRGWRPPTTRRPHHGMSLPYSYGRGRSPDGGAGSGLLSSWVGVPGSTASDDVVPRTVQHASDYRIALAPQSFTLRIRLQHWWQHAISKSSMLPSCIWLTPSPPSLHFQPSIGFRAESDACQGSAPPACAVGALPLPINPITVCPFPTSMVVEDLLMVVPEAVYSVVGLVFRDVRHLMMWYPSPCNMPLVTVLRLHRIFSLCVFVCSIGGNTQFRNLPCCPRVYG